MSESSVHIPPRKQPQPVQLGLVHYSALATITGLLIGAALLVTFGVSGNAGKPLTAIAAEEDSDLLEESKNRSANTKSNSQLLKSRRNQQTKTVVAVIPGTDAELSTKSIEKNRGESVAATTSEIQLSDEECCKIVIGDWTMQYYGRRVLSIRNDGTATLVVTPNEVGAFLFGPRLQFEIDWRVEDGNAIFQTTGGSPAKKVKLANKMWGKNWIQTILDLSDDRLLLLGEDGETQYDWKRLSARSAE